jgi:hypothetical protein
MKTKCIGLILLLSATTANAAFFLDSAALQDLLAEFEAYQDKRQIRYMAKASQYVGYVTGVVDALDGTGFCLPGGVTAEQAAGLVAKHVREHPEPQSRRGLDVVISALAANFPCKH